MNMNFKRKLPIPKEIKEMYPISDEGALAKEKNDLEIAKVFTGESDKLVLVKLSSQPEQWAEIFVELKGSDVGHALTQLIETIKRPIFKHQSNVIKRARIVATSFPANKSNPDIERKKITLLILLLILFFFVYFLMK